jgi:hypothetical protein
MGVKSPIQLIVPSFVHTTTNCDKKLMQKYFTPKTKEMNIFEVCYQKWKLQLKTQINVLTNVLHEFNLSILTIIPCLRIVKPNQHRTSNQQFDFES